MTPAYPHEIPTVLLEQAEEFAHFHRRSLELSGLLEAVRCHRLPPPSRPMPPRVDDLTEGGVCMRDASKYKNKWTNSIESFSSTSFSRRAADPVRSKS